MEDELIDITDQYGTLTGERVLKSLVHKKGFYHHTAHIWLYTKYGQIVLQQRAKTKTIHPLLWDVSVAGHVDAGETIKQGGLREMKEELGLELQEKDLKKIGVFKCFKTYDFGIIDNEFHNTFIAELNEPFNTLKPCPKEVEALKLVSINEFKELLKHSTTNSHFIESNTSYYLKVLDAINKKINI